MFLFSYYVPSAEDRYDLAYIFLYFIAFNMTLNVLYLVFTIERKIHSACRSFFIRRRARKAKAMNVIDGREKEE